MRILSLFTSLVIFVFSIYLQAKEVPFTVIHTNDLHSYVSGLGPDSQFTPEIDGDKVRGHFARLSTLIKKVQSEKSNQPVVTIDAGDFYSGTIYHLLSPNPNIDSSPEIEFFIYNNYDFSTIGNHEFDAGVKGLETMLSKLEKQSTSFKLLASNLDYSTLPGNLKPYFSERSEPKAQVVDHYIKTYQYKNEIFKIGFLGVIGPDALDISRSLREGIRGYGYSDATLKEDITELYPVLQKKVDLLKKEKQVDIVIVTMHAGTPEDELIAKNVNGIDVIIAGHTHSLYPKPKLVGKTLISQAGSYGEYLGVLNFLYKDGKVQQVPAKKHYQLVNDKVDSDVGYLRLEQKYRADIDKVIKPLGYKYDSYVYTSQIKLKKGQELRNRWGTIIATGIRSELNKLEDEPVDIYLSTMGVIRQNLDFFGDSADFQFSDIFKIMPLGFDKNLGAGFPIVTFYVKRSDVKKLANFLDFYKSQSNDFSPVYSDNLSFKSRKYGIPLINKIGKFKLDGKKYRKWPKYVKVATSSFAASFLDQIRVASKGLVKIKPRNKEGQPTAPVVTEHKEFKLLADYFKDLKVLK